jgi:quercetin dioxygenase-like cupin family protein
MEHFNNKALATLPATTLLLLLLAPLLTATDPDPLQDFCVADLNGKPSVNGYPCQPSSSAGDQFLFSSRIASGGDTRANPNGSNVTELDVNEWPGLNTLGVSMNRVDFAPGGTNPPHVHPRATEVGIVTRGELLVGIVGTLDSGNRYYSKVVRAGETFVIPRGLVHFQFNVGKEQATMVVSFNSQNPGIVFIPLTLFGSSPPIPTPVLVKALRVDAEVVELLKSKFTGGY